MEAIFEIRSCIEILANDEYKLYSYTDIFETL